MTTRKEGSGRRKFLVGLAAGAGVAATALALRGRRPAAESDTAKTPAGPVLYRRTAETERYYKTLYT